MKFEIQPIGFVQAERVNTEDDYWGKSRSRIRLADHLSPTAISGLEAFSHVEIIFLFDKVDPTKIVEGARHPRNNQAWPEIGIFAQRGKNRPNRLGSTICKVYSVHENELEVEELDAIDGTPIIDIKPVIREFLPRGDVTQPLWATELMADYWKEADS